MEGSSGTNVVANELGVFPRLRARFSEGVVTRSILYYTILYEFADSNALSMPKVITAGFLLD